MKTSVVPKLVEEVLSLEITKKITKNIMKKKCKKTFPPSMFSRKSSADITPVTCLSNSATRCCCGTSMNNGANSRRSSTSSTDESQEYLLSLTFFAIQYKNVQLLEEVLERSLLDVNQHNEDGITATHFAAIVGSTDCISVLQQYGCCVNVLDIRGQTPLYYAKMMENVDTVKKLKGFGAE